MDRCGLMTVQAAREAWTASGAEVDDPTRVGVVIGSCVGGFAMLEAGARQLEARGPDRISPHLIGALLVDTPDELRGHRPRRPRPELRRRLRLRHRRPRDRRGGRDGAPRRRRPILAGGVEALHHELILGGFCIMRALGTPRDPDDPASASRPFDATRDGFIVGEGAAWSCWSARTTPGPAARRSWPSWSATARRTTPSTSRTRTRRASASSR